MPKKIIVKRNNYLRLKLLVKKDRRNQVFLRFFISMVKVSELRIAIAVLATAVCIAKAKNNKISILTWRKVLQ